MALEAAFAAQLWRYPGDVAWYFLTLPLDVADEIRSRVEPSGFGSVRVTATIGATTWRTSVFPDKASGSYVLPAKAAVRKAENLEPGMQTRVHLTIHT